jgi:hypothetical protein
VSQSKKRKTDRSEQQKAGKQRDGGVSGSVRLSEIRNERRPVLTNLISFAGYMAGVWLMLASINSFGTTPATGSIWSPALLGSVLVLATAVVMNDKGIRNRLTIFDEKNPNRLAYTLAWGALGLMAIFGIMTWPTY